MSKDDSHKPGKVYTRKATPEEMAIFDNIKPKHVPTWLKEKAWIAGQTSTKGSRIATSKRYREKHREECNAKARARYANDAEFRAREAERKRIWKQNNRDKVLAQKARYRERHRDEIRAKARERYANNAEFRERHKAVAAECNRVRRERVRVSGD